jgi:hypothetical protein
MPKYIDIKEFDGVLTNADIEDLPDNVAQEIKNLKVQAGKLEKTFGAGSPSGVPLIGISIVDSETSESYTVYNVFTFISDKFSGDTNEAGDGYRYLLVTVEATSQEVKLFWWDSGKPDVTDHLQIENNILYFKTASAHGLTTENKILVQDCKDNASPKVAIAGSGAFQTIDVVPSTTDVYVNTNNARAWNGGFFDNTLLTGFKLVPSGGKFQTHQSITDTLSYGGNDASSVNQIAIESMNGNVLSMAVCLTTGNDNTDLVYSNGTGGFSDLTTSIYTTIDGYPNFGIGSMIAFNDGIYVHFTYTLSGVDYNRIVKYTLNSSNLIQETEIVSNLSSTSTAGISYMYVAGTGDLYILLPSNGLWKIDTAGTATSITILGVTLANMKGLTSIISTNLLNADGSTSFVDVKHEYLFFGETDGTDYDLYYNDIRSSSHTAYEQYGSSSVGNLKHLKKMDFDQYKDRSESVIVHFINGSNTRLQYSTHNDTTVINTFLDVDSGTFSSSTDIQFIESALKSPSGTKYLIVGTDDDSGPPQASGKLYTVSSSITVKTIANPNTASDKSNWNPMCFADCTTGTGFFTYAKGYIGVWGTDALTDAGDESGDVYRFTDIGWLNYTWNSAGDCEYRWIYLNDTFDFGTHYHKKDRNPIIPFGDSVRLLTGNIAKVGSNEAKGVWIGHIDRSIMNDGVVQGPAFFGYSNVLDNPFAFSNDQNIAVTADELRDTNTVKYNLTAIYDGVQETELDSDKALEFDGDGSGNTDDISKSRIQFGIDMDFTTLSKRITGFNIYRSGRYAGVWETYKKINEINLLRADDSFTDDKEVTVESGNDDIAYIYDSDGWISANNGSFGSGTWAVKVGTNIKRKFTGAGGSFSNIQGYVELGPVLDADIGDTDTIVAVDTVSGLSVSQDIRINDEQVLIVGISSLNLTVTRAQGGTTAKAHGKYSELRRDSISNSKWWKFDVNGDNFKGRKFNNSWAIYKRLGYDDGFLWQKQHSASSGSYAGGYVGWLSPSSYEDSNGDLSLKGWRDGSGNIVVSSLAGKNIIFEANETLYKLDEISSYDSHTQRAFIQIHKRFPAGTYNELGQITAETSYTDNGSSSYTVTVTDEGLVSLGEHWGESVYSIRTNPQYAKLLKGRMFYANLVLDIGDKDEAQNDWVGYSELDAFDVRPVSNVIPFQDREGGQITGLAELFGRLIIFKPQAIFVLDVSNPSDPTSWTRKESKHNIGNIAPEGVVEVHDSVYFVHHDGIYKLDSNTLASSEATPSIIEKITLPIEDQFLLADSKSAVKGIYDQKNNELLFTWDISSTQVVWAYHIFDKIWRKVETSANLDILAYGENSGPICWDATDTDIKKFDVNEAVGIHWKSKRFPLDMDRKRLLRYGTVRFTGTDDLTVNVYLDGNSSADFTKVITADGGINKFPIKRYGKKFEIELTTTASTNTFFVEQMRIEME